MHMFTYPPNQEVLTDKLSGLLFGRHRGEEPGSGLEQCGLCVSCPQDA